MSGMHGQVCSVEIAYQSKLVPTNYRIFITPLSRNRIAFTSLFHANAALPVTLHSTLHARFIHSISRKHFRSEKLFVNLVTRAFIVMSTCSTFQYRLLWCAWFADEFVTCALVMCLQSKFLKASNKCRPQVKERAVLF